MGARVAPPLAISLGDPAGVGPELIATAWTMRDTNGLPPFMVIGGARILAEAAAQRGIAVPVRAIADVAEAAGVFATALPVLELDADDTDVAYCPGKPDPAGARLALNSLRTATNLVVEGLASGVVTGPVSKARLAEEGFTHPGQTEFVAAQCGVASHDAVMLLAGPQLKAVPLTVHCALADVPGLLSQDLICNRTRIVAHAMVQDFGIAHPRLAICALNPHAGEEGRMGSEEQAIIAPAIAALQAEGIDATGPHAADSLFSPHARPHYDVALAMYHDQALIPLKALDFDAGVNMTLGLPIVRTSPDHGTAFAIAGQGTANPGAMVAAIRMAGAAAARRAATPLSA
ncbi:MAG: 4-hydroxythreonine-4-phosphate dehydrogenase PdxA [Novosphingobium sp.]